MCLEQFRLRNFKLAHPNGKDFAVSPWFPLAVTAGYRLLLALYCLGWIIYSIISDNTWKGLLYLTVWTFICVTSYFICSTSISVTYWIHTYHNLAANHEPVEQQLPEDCRPSSIGETSSGASYYVTPRQSTSDSTESLLEEQYSHDVFEDIDVAPAQLVLPGDHASSCAYPSYASDEDYSQAWYHKVSWVFYAIAANNCLVVTVVYWTLLYTGYHVGGADVTFHLLNSFFMLTETFLSSIPVQLFHVIYAMLYGVLYVLFTVVYWSFGGTNDSGDRFIYPILDYSHKPVAATVLIVLYGLLGLPVAQLIHFGLFKLRCYLRT